MKILGILILLLICFIIYSFLDEAFEKFKNRRIEKKGSMLKILVKDSVKSKNTEALIRNIHSTLLNTKIREFTQGRPWMSYEIAATKDKITFYLWVPKDYKNLIMERMYATYSEIAIEEIEEDYLEDKNWTDLFDYITYLFKKIIKKENVKKPKKNHSSIFGTEMELAFHHVLSLNKVLEQEDILKSIFASMKNLEWHEKVVVQVLARPINGFWQFKGRKILEEYVRTGITPSKRGRKLSINENLASEMDEIIKNEISEFKLPSSTSRATSSSRKTPYERKEIAGATDKIMDVGFETVIRLATIGNFKKQAKSRLKMLSASFNELDKENKLTRKYIYFKKIFYKRLKNRRVYIKDRKNILSAGELSKFFLRLPDIKTVDEFYELEKLLVKEFSPPLKIEREKLLLGENKYRGKITPIGIKRLDLARHIIVQGKTGTGKSEFAKWFALELMKENLGFALFEPHGKLANEILQLIPENRRKDVIIFDLMSDYPPEFNLCKINDKVQGKIREQTVEKVTKELVEMNSRLFSEAWSSRNAYYLENAIKTVIEIKGNYIDIRRLFSDANFRKQAMKKLQDNQIKHFWNTEFKLDNKGNLPAATQSTVSSIDYKLGSFLNTKSLLRAVGQDDCIDFKDVLDNNKILIFRFDKEKMSEEQITFIGGIAIKLILISAFMRDKARCNEPFVVFIDEAQNFVDASIKTILEEARKYGLSLFFMHQILSQLDKVKGLKDALYGNVGTKISFTAGDIDAPFFESVFEPKVDRYDIKNLPSRNAYCKLSVDGAPSDTFNFRTYDTPTIDKKEGLKCFKEIIENNNKGRLHYTEIDKLIDEKLIKSDKIYDDVSDLNINNDLDQNIELEIEDGNW